MTEAHPQQRTGRRVRMVTARIKGEPADTSPQLEAVKAALDVEPGWWKRHRLRVPVILGIVAAIAMGGYAARQIVGSAEAQETEQAELVKDVKSISARLSNIEGQLKILVERK